MSLTSTKTIFDREGFAVVPQFLTPIELSELTEELDRYIRDVVPRLSDAHAFYQDRVRPETLKQMQYMQVDPFFLDYTQHPKWKQLAETLVGESALCESPEWFNKPAGIEHPTPPHQDNYYFNLQPSNVVTIWLALDDVDDENGCLRYLPGSHQRGFRPHGRSKVLGFSQGITDFGPDDHAQEVKIHLQPGDAVAHHGMTIHRAEPNRSQSRNRRAFAMVFKGVSCRRDEAGFARYQESAKQQHEQMGLKT
ncbi:MAG: ptlH 2 [Planctomycetaceae bacterium]|nr:ptlH 2 [Planctomycetaceae bacterium]